MESEPANGSNEHVKKTPGVKHENELPLLEGENRGVYSPSSSSLEVGIVEKDPLHNSPFDGNPSSRPGSISSPDITTQANQWSMVSTSPRAESNVSPELSSEKSPQTGQPPGYDPNRIPASIFNMKPANPTEWSVASNESLFSIHMTNNSFSNDYAIMFGKSGELPRLDELNNKSGEFPRLGEWNNSQSNRRYVSEGKSNDLTSLPPVMELPSHEESSLQSDDISGTGKKEDKGSPKVVLGATPENHDVGKAPSAETTHSSSCNPMSFPSPPRLSNESGNSCKSFAFPVLASESGKPNSMKVVAEKPEQQPQTQGEVSKETTEPNETRWFSCFPCWPRCC